MNKPTGKTHAILQRLPHFYDSQVDGDLLVQFVDLFGRSLERAELDLYQVLRAHHVETADNIGSRGYTAAPDQRGDLDKIFALYLEVIGGTTQLVKMSPRFSARSLHMRQLVQRLREDDNPFIAAIKADFQPETHTLLTRYAVENSWFQPTDIQSGFALALILGKTGVAAYIRQRLTSPTRALLAAYTGSSALDPRLQAALATDLNRVILRDPAFYRQNADEFDQYDLSKATWALLRGIYRDFLRRRYAHEPDPVKKTGLLTYLDQAEATPAPPGDDQVRLNRLLLTSAFAYHAQERPWGFAAQQIPSLGELRTALVAEFNLLLESKALFQPDWFPELVDEYPALRQRYHNDRVWLNRVVLEAAFPTAIEKSYTPYQERLRGLIQVLRSGASTRAGIIALVAANLGLVDDTPATQLQRQRIRVEEFEPVTSSQHYPAVQLASRFVVDNPHSVIRVHNPNQVPVIPEIQLRIQVQGHSKDLVTFTYWSLINRTTGQQVLYDGVLKDGDWLTLTSDQRARRNGVPTQTTGTTPTLPPGESLLHIEALTGLSLGRFDRTLLDSATFGDAADNELRVLTPGRFDETPFDTVLFDRATLDHPSPEQVADVALDVEIKLIQLTPGHFRVSIPWDLGDFPADETDPTSHPRNQIRGIIDKVKAAGVFATISYEQQFADQHDLGEGELTRQLHQPVTKSQMPVTPHAMTDRLLTVGVFDYTGFDSLNALA